MVLALSTLVCFSPWEEMKIYRNTIHKVSRLYNTNSCFSFALQLSFIHPPIHSFICLVVRSKLWRVWDTKLKASQMITKSFELSSYGVSPRPPLPPFFSPCSPSQPSSGTAHNYSLSPTQTCGCNKQREFEIRGKSFDQPCWSQLHWWKQQMRSPSSSGVCGWRRRDEGSGCKEAHFVSACRHITGEWCTSSLEACSNVL